MQKQKNKKSETGITLIALVVSIIVLIILAGVSITMLVGENGIITQAQRAKENTELAEKQEKEDMSELEDEINEAITGIEVEQVADENPGQLEQESENILVINSIEDLVYFSYDVSNGNTYEGQTVKLGLSLDFNSNKSYVEPLRTNYGEYGYDGELKTLLTSEEGFKPIGSIEDIKDGSNCFGGIFDGDNKELYNLYIDGTFEETSIIGMFSTNFGVIKNLRINNINFSINSNGTYCLLGGISGRNSGTIINCLVSGNIECSYSGENSITVGGIVGQGYQNSILNNCANKCDINANVNTGTRSYWRNYS